MGDVLMTVPVVEAFARQHPDVRITMVSRAWAKPIFDLLPGNVKFVTADLHGEHAGYRGLNLLTRKLLALQPTQVADLHDVLRTKWMRLRFKAAGIKVAHIKKNRRARKAFLTLPEKQPQTSVFEKYVNVFYRLGFTEWSLDFHSLFPAGGASIPTFFQDDIKAVRPERYWAAIAPFSAHDGKTYPLTLMEEVVRQLSAHGDIRLFLFGAGKNETTVLQEWATRYPHTENMAGQLQNIGQELALISHCGVMLSMDSGNMHLASLAAVPVVSVWGATHPYSGFLGYGQSYDQVLQRTDLTCRPCSIYGEKPCQFGDYRCLTRISPEEIIAKMLKVLTQ